MPNYKVTFLFNQGERGFSETYYRTDSTVELCLTAAKLWGGIRARAMAKDIKFMAIKVQDDAEFGDSTIDTECRGFQRQDEVGDITAAGCLVRIQAGTRHRRSHIYRGFPDGFITRTDPGGQLIPQPLLVGYLDGFAAHLIDTAWQLRYTLDDLDADPDPTPIIGLERNNDAKSVTLVEAANWAEFQKGDQCVIRGCRGKAKSLNGVRTVTATPLANKVSVSWPFGRIERFEAEDIAAANIRGYDFGYVNITRCHYIDIRTRQTGRAFFEPAGKSKSRL